MSTVTNSTAIKLELDQPLAQESSSWETTFHLAMALATAIVLVVSVLAYYFGHLAISFPQIVPKLVLMVGLLAVAFQYKWRREAKCFNIIMMVFWVIVITNCHFFPMYLAARQDVPMSDSTLAAFDRAIGIEVPTVRALLAPYPQFNQFMLFVYTTLIPLMTLATVLPPLVGRMDKAKEFAIGCLIAASISMPIFACFQAVGPWHHYEFEPVIDSLSQKAAMLASLKTDSWFLIDVDNKDGLITFPSFHVVLTVLAAIALKPIRYVGWPAMVWAALIVVSTVTTGIHYTIDVFGGLAVAAIALVGARVYLRWERTRPSPATATAAQSAAHPAHGQPTTSLASSGSSSLVSPTDR